MQRVFSYDAISAFAQEMAESEEEFCRVDQICSSEDYEEYGYKDLPQLVPAYDWVIFIDNDDELKVGSPAYCQMMYGDPILNASGFMDLSQGLCFTVRSDVADYLTENIREVLV